MYKLTILLVKSKVMKQSLSISLFTTIQNNMLFLFICVYLYSYVFLYYFQQQNGLYACHLCEKKFTRGHSLTTHLHGDHNYKWPSGHKRFRLVWILIIISICQSDFAFSMQWNLSIPIENFVSQLLVYIYQI